MGSARGVNIDRLHRDIDATRTIISRTVGELQKRVGEAMHWETYAQRHPGPVLTGAALIGLLAGRKLARRFMAHDCGPSDQGRSPETSTEARASTPFDTGGRDRFAAASASWQRLGSRVETLVNRVIDEVAAAAEQRVVPAVVGGVHTLFEGRRTHPVHRPVPEDGGSSAPARESRLP